MLKFDDDDDCMHDLKETLSVPFPFCTADHEGSGVDGENGRAEYARALLLCFPFGIYVFLFLFLPFFFLPRSRLTPNCSSTTFAA